MAEQFLVGVGHVGVCRNHFLRNDENVDRRLRVDVTKGQTQIVFIDNLGRNFPLDDLQKERNIAFLFIAHNLAVVEHFSDDVAVMYLGRIVERASSRDRIKGLLIASPANPTGTLIAPERLAGLVQVCAERGVQLVFLDLGTPKARDSAPATNEDPVIVDASTAEERGLVDTCGNCPWMDRWDQVRVTSLALRSKTDEVADGQDVVATGAPAAESQLATHQIASVTSSFSQEAFLTGGTFVYRLSDQPLLPTQCVGEIGECRSVRLPVAERYERGSVCLTSNLPFSKWEQVFKDPMTTAAAIDRLVHHSVIVELTGPSYRAEAAKRAKANPE